MRFRPANIKVINRRDDRRVRRPPAETANGLDRFVYIRTLVFLRICNPPLFKVRNGLKAGNKRRGLTSLRIHLLAILRVSRKMTKHR